VKRILAASAVIFGLLATVSCAFASGQWDDGSVWLSGSGYVTSENRVVSSFSGIDVEGSGDVELSQGLIQSVSVECDDNLLPVVKTEVVGSVLLVGFKPGTHVSHVTRLRFRVTIPTIDSLTISGSGGMRAMTTLQSNRLSLLIKGSGSMDANLDVAHLTSTINGSGNIRVNGNAEDIEVTINGSGSMQARSLGSASAAVHINGSGSAQVNARDTIAIHIAGSGDVEYGGGGRSTISISGSGSVRQR
jgi:hypothetical protein